MDKTNKIRTIEWDKVSCCENCGNKENTTRVLKWESHIDDLGFARNV